MNSYTHDEVNNRVNELFGYSSIATIRNLNNQLGVYLSGINKQIDKTIESSKAINIGDNMGNTANSIIEFNQSIQEKLSKLKSVYDNLNTIYNIYKNLENVYSMLNSDADKIESILKDRIRVTDEEGIEKWVKPADYYIRLKIAQVKMDNDYNKLNSIKSNLNKSISLIVD